MVDGMRTAEFPRFVQRHLDAIVELAKAHGVARLEIFGSVMTDRYHPLVSDVDFLVAFPSGNALRLFRQYLALQDDLRFLIGSPLDLVMDTALDNEEFRHEANMTRKLIYEMDRDRVSSQAGVGC